MKTYKNFLQSIESDPSSTMTHTYLLELFEIPIFFYISANQNMTQSCVPVSSGPFISWIFQAAIDGRIGKS